MTLAAQMRSDVLSVFLVTDDHAESVAYTRPDGIKKTIKAIVDRGEDLADAASDDGRFRLRRLSISIATDAAGGVAVPKDGDSVAIDGDIFRVVGRPLRDGFGMQRLDLERLEVVEKSTRDYRIER